MTVKKSSYSICSIAWCRTNSGARYSKFNHALNLWRNHAFCVYLRNKCSLVRVWTVFSCVGFIDWQIFNLRFMSTSKGLAHRFQIISKRKENFYIKYFKKYNTSYFKQTRRSWVQSHQRHKTIFIWNTNIWFEILDKRNL